MTTPLPDLAMVPTCDHCTNWRSDGEPIVETRCNEPATHLIMWQTGHMSFACPPHMRPEIFARDAPDRRLYRLNEEAQPG